MLILFATALADVPPPVGYVETCTVAKQSAGGRECKACSAYHSGREPCETLEAEGYTSQCKTRGASVWTEVMCKGAAQPVKPAKPAPETPSDTPDQPTIPEAGSPPESTSRCSTLGGGASWLAVLLPFIARRR